MQFEEIPPDKKSVSSRPSGDGIVLIGPISDSTGRNCAMKFTGLFVVQSSIA
jgi:hypothetical protein